MTVKFKNLLLLSLALLMSCSNDINEISTSLDVETRSSVDAIVRTDYYWYKDKKISIERVPNKTFVVFNSSKREMLLNSCAKTKAESGIASSESFPFGREKDLPSDAKKYLEGRQMATLNISPEEASKIDGIDYVAPFYKVEGSDDFPLTDQIYVSLKDDSDLPVLEKAAKNYNLIMTGKYEGIPHFYILVCTKDSNGNALTIANALHESGEFEYAEPAFMANKLSSVDPLYSQQWNLHNTGQFGAAYAGYDINYENALHYLTPSSSNAIIAVIDGGVELTHSDLNIHSFSWDAHTNSSPSVVYNSHGTNVAGIISAKKDNGIGIAGITGGISIMSLSNYLTGSGSNRTFTDSELASSIRKAVDNGAWVINNSWGGGTRSTTIDNAIDYAVKNGRNGRGCVVVFSACNNNNSSISYPASYYHNNDVIAVGAITYKGKRKSINDGIGTDWGSNYGPELDVVAPGVLIPTTTIGNSWITTFDGTSAAAPHVSAIAAEMISHSPYLSNQEIEYIINHTANKNLPGYSFGSGRNNEVGYGLVDADAAITMAKAVINSTSTSVTLSGNTMLYVDRFGGSAYTTLYASPSNSSYQYFWSAEFGGTCSGWYLYPTNSGTAADITINLDNQQYGGTLRVTCRVYNGTSFVGAGTAYVNVSKQYEE